MIKENIEETNSSENEYQGFVCDNPYKADWAIERIKEARQRRDLYISAAEKKIEQLKEQIELQRVACDNQTAYLFEQLNNFLDTVPAKKAKTQISLDLPSGKIVRKLSKPEFVKDDAKLLEYLQNNSPDMITWTPKVKWGDLKKNLTVSDDSVIRTDTGEIIDPDCISVEMSAETIDIK